MLKYWYIILLFLMGFLFGCASQHSRSKEFRDVFDISIQQGVGANIHASIFGLGMGSNETLLGIEDGCSYSYKTVETKPHEFGFLLLNAHANISDQASKRHKQYAAWKLLGIYPSGPDGKALLSKPYFTKFTISASIGYGFKVGFNPGELLDFSFSFLNGSIYNCDDI